MASGSDQAHLAAVALDLAGLASSVAVAEEAAGAEVVGVAGVVELGAEAPLMVAMPPVVAVVGQPVDFAVQLADFDRRAGESVRLE